MLSETDRVGEWLQVRNSRGAVTGTLRWMWQQFPTEWEVTPDQLVMHLWSPARWGVWHSRRREWRRFLASAAGRKYLAEAPAVKSDSRLERLMNFAGLAAMERGEADGIGTNKTTRCICTSLRPRFTDEGAEYGRLAARQPLPLARRTELAPMCLVRCLRDRTIPATKSSWTGCLTSAERGKTNSADYGWWVFGAGPHYSYQWDPINRRHYADPRA